MTYDLEDFCRDTRAALDSAATSDALEVVGSRLNDLLSNEVFVQRTCGTDVPQGLYTLYEDDRLGFQVLAHVNEKPRVSPPHNHGSSWAVYGQAIGFTDMTEYSRIDDRSNPAFARLEIRRQYRLSPGDVGVYVPGVIHSIDYPAKSRFIRITGTNLDRIARDAFDLATGTIRRVAPQQAT